MEPDETFVRSPDYGSGMARRRIRLTGEPGRVLGELEDHAHAMRCLIEHDGQAITAVTSEFRRAPLTTCLGAGEPLSEIVGMPIGCDFSTFFQGGRARLNCTHMFDIAWLATAHAVRGETIRDYLVEIPDESDGPVDARLLRDGEVVLRWPIEDGVIAAPPVLAGRHLLRGFTRWALEHLEGDALEAALVFQKGYFVAGARRYIIPMGPLSALERVRNAGLCHGFGSARIEEAVRLPGTKRDFTDHPERLLKFL